MTYPFSLQKRVTKRTYKSTYQILKELSEVWDNLTDINRANILEKIGGKRNANVTAAIIENFSQAEKALQTSMNSAGSALAENEKYLDSIEGRVSKFRASWQSLSADFFNGDFIKGVVSGADTIVSGLDSIIAKFGAIPTLIGTVTAAMSGWRISQGQRTGIIDFIANPEAGRSHVRILNNDLKELGATIKDVYKSYYSPGENAGRMGKAFAGAKAGLKGTFGMIGASIVSNSSEIKEYRPQAPTVWKPRRMSSRPEKHWFLITGSWLPVVLSGVNTLMRWTLPVRLVKQHSRDIQVG